MKRGKALKVIALALAMVMLFSVTAFADSGHEHYDFEQRTLNLAPGDLCHFSIQVYDGYKPTYSVYMVGNTDKNSYVWSDFKTGWSYLDIHIGENETAKRITLYVYEDEQDQYDTIDINVVEPEKSYLKETREKAVKAKMAIAEKYKFTYDEALAVLATAPKTLEEIALLPMDDQWKYYYAALTVQQGK